jgi:hypothetical protein
MTIVIGNPAWDLPTLNTFVSQQEDFLRGPLTKISNDGTNTTLDIDDTLDKPAKNAAITTAVPPAGMVIINTDKIFISGTLITATAYRPT